MHLHLISQFLTHALGLTLWEAISEASRPLRILVPLICGWIWNKEDTLDQAKDILRLWQYWETSSQEWIDMSALCNWVIGFSSVSLIPWNVASSLVSALEEIILCDTQVDTAVVTQIAAHHGVTKGTGIILGSVSETGQAEYHIYTRSYIATNLFGLQFPSNCPDCGSRTSCGKVSRPPTTCVVVPRRIFCKNCRWRTQWFQPPKEAVVEHDADLFSWRLPLAQQAWKWQAPLEAGAKTTYGLSTLSY